MKISSKHLCLALMIAVAGVSHTGTAGAETSPAAAAKPAPKEVPLSGTALETMDTGGYTYILLKNGDQKTWVAAPLMKVTVGQELSLLPGYEMKNFTSKGLNRKFDRIVFSAGPAKNNGMKLGTAALKMVHEGVQAAPQGSAAKAAQPQAQAKTQAIDMRRSAPVSIQQVQKAKGRNAYTVAQLYAKKQKLEKKPVVVRGRVVKVTPRVLKRTWVHIQDGSGSPAKKNNNLIVTMKEMPQVGDVITVKGTLYNNMDFGSGYRYGLLVDARQ